MARNVTAPAIAASRQQHEPRDGRLTALMIGVEQVDRDATGCRNRCAQIVVVAVTGIANGRLPETNVSRRDVDVPLLFGEGRRVGSKVPASVPRCPLRIARDALARLRLEVITA